MLPHVVFVGFSLILIVVEIAAQILRLTPIIR
jgi:hypothetical protein